MSKRPLVHIIDGSGYIFRAFYAIRSLSTSKGEPTNAVHGFASMIQKLLQDEKPDHVAITFDSGRHTFRQTLYPDYKAHRPPMPEDLVPQIPRIRQVAAAFRLPTFESADYEADDLIATIAKKAIEADHDVVIVTGDKDLMQLVGEHVTVFDPMKDKRIGPKEVEEKFGVPPTRVVDALALAGDASDNVPGVRGVGPKTATKLLLEYGSVEGVLEAAKANKIKGKVGEKIAASEAEAMISKKLVTLVDDAPLEDFDLDKLRYEGPDREAQRTLFTELEFSRLIPDPTTELIPGATSAKATSKIEHEDYLIIRTPAELSDLAEALSKVERIAIEVELSSTRLVDAEVYGFALAYGEGHAAYVPVGHEYEGCPGQLDTNAVAQGLAGVLESLKVAKLSSSSKAVYAVMRRHGVEVVGLSFDVTLASYLLDPDQSSHDPVSVARRMLGLELESRESVTGRGRDKREFFQAPIDKAAAFLGQAADASLRAYETLQPLLEEAEVANVLTDVEMPLVPVLARMELNGIRVDLDLIDELSARFGEDLVEVERKCYEAAGQEFNLGSPKQLQKVLYEDLGLKILKRTKTGPSTDASVLEELVDEHPLPQLILEYRQLAKLRSTYVDALPKLICEKTGRVHTSYSQATAATGRLSSRDPNLQNIPIRTETGRQLRKIFVADEGNQLISVDYSQIELRVLAHLSKEPLLIESFKNEEDIHTRTASVLFDIPLDQVTREQRSQAKAVNFGVLYGMGPVRLARQLQIPRRTASQFVKDYFTKQPNVRRLIDDTLDEAREQGVVRTILGRRRIVRDITSRNRVVRAQAERIAINTPIQGSAADLIKMAMIRVAARIEEQPEVRLLLQVHDELLLEAPANLAGDIAAMVKREMENIFPLDVPLTAEAHVGVNWDEAH